jgi:hypothetical protein
MFGSVQMNDRKRFLKNARVRRYAEIILAIKPMIDLPPDQAHATASAIMSAICRGSIPHVHADVESAGR